MPDIWTHILCGQDTIESLEKNRWNNIIDTRLNLFNLGCQGPDIFLYNDFLPWIKDKRGPKIGRTLHTEKTGEFFIEAATYLKDNLEDKDSFRDLFTYVCGFICHFGLDRNAHPYIHYYAGKYDKTKAETHKYRGYHKRLELMIDTIMVKEKKDINAFNYPVHKEISLSHSIPSGVVDFFRHVISKLYRLDIDEDTVTNSYRDMIKVLKITYDPIGIKKVLLNGVDLIIKNDVNYATVTYPRRIDSSRDYLNRKHSIWSHPCNKTEIYSESFDDIYDRASIQSREMIKALICYLEGKTSIEELRFMFPNISYSTGKNTNDKCELKYYDPIF